MTTAERQVLLDDLTTLDTLLAGLGRNIIISRAGADCVRDFDVMRNAAAALRQRIRSARVTDAPPPPPPPADPFCRPCWTGD